MGLGGQDGNLMVYDIPGSQNMANYDTGSPLRSICFSENGIFVASTSAGAQEVKVFDLRKGVLMTTVHTAGEVFHAKWDYTGLFLAIASAGSVSVEEYSKKSKAFNSLMSAAVPATDVAWGESAKSLVVLTSEGSLFSFA